MWRKIIGFDAIDVWTAYSNAIRARQPDNPSPHSPSDSGMTKAIPPPCRVRIGWKPPFVPRLAPWPLAISPPFGRKNPFQATPGMPERQSFGSRMNICTRRVKKTGYVLAKSWFAIERRVYKCGFYTRPLQGIRQGERLPSPCWS